MGFSLIEVLVTIVILLIGLLGLAGLQGRALTAQMESYQRAQALVLLKDMAGRISANSQNASSYVTTGLGIPYLGTDNASADCTAAAAGQPRDFCEWNNALLGAAEVQGTNSPVGAMIGARGCVIEVSPVSKDVPGVYIVAVAWQGLNSTSSPTTNAGNAAGDCAKGKYYNRDHSVNEALHRVISLPVNIAYLLP